MAHQAKRILWHTHACCTHGNAEEPIRCLVCAVAVEHQPCLGIVVLPDYQHCMPILRLRIGAGFVHRVLRPGLAWVKAGRKVTVDGHPGDCMAVAPHMLLDLPLLQK